MTTPITTTADRLMELAAKATRGPWQVIADYHPYRIRDDSVERHHTELRIFTEWDHPQLKGPVGVVNHSVGIGIDKPVHMVNMAAEDAGYIAACDPQTITALCSAIKEMAAERDAANERAESLLWLCRNAQEMTALHAEMLAEAMKERDHWKANHADMVKRATILRDRPDCPLERVLAFEEVGKAFAERDALRQQMQDQVERLRAELEAARADAGRLDWLDEQNARKNRNNRTRYGWALNENHNRIALEDHAWPPVSVRAAIDAAMNARKEG